MTLQKIENRYNSLKEKIIKVLSLGVLMAELCEECGKIVSDPYETAHNLDDGCFHSECYEKKEIREGHLIIE